MIMLDCEWDEGGDYFLAMTSTGLAMHSRGQAAAWIQSLPPGETLVGHFLRNDLHQIGAYPRCPVVDTGTISWLLDENPPHGLKPLAARYLGQQLSDPISVHAGHVMFNGLPIAQADPALVERYCRADVLATGRLYERLLPRLDAAQRRWFDDVEGPPLDRRLWETEMSGVAVDPQRLGLTTLRFKRHRIQEQRAVWDAVGYEFNLSSPLQASKVLFSKSWTQAVATRVEDGTYATGARAGQPRYRIHRQDVQRDGLGLRPIKANEEGDGWSVGRDALAPYQDIPAVSHMIQYRELNKLLTTYLERWPPLLERDGRLRTTYNSVGTVTGRMSSRAPNLQNIPVRTNLGHMIRNLFVPRPGNVLLVVDLSQVEMRITAALSGDPVLLGAFRHGQDIYEDLAGRIGVSRSVAKTACLAQNYGSGPGRIAEVTGLTPTEAAALLAAINRTWGGVSRWRGEVEQQLSTAGFVTLPSGRRRTPKLTDDKPWARARARRQAVNAGPQGMCADIIKRMMVEAPVAPILQVHDELVWDVSPEAADAIEAQALTSLEQAAADYIDPRIIELTATVKRVKRWGDAKD